MSTALLGIDIGSTNVKSIIISPTGKVLALAKIPTRNFAHLDKKGQCTLSACVAQLCKEVTEKAPNCTIKAMAISCVGSGGIFLDENDTKFLLPKIEKNLDPVPHISEKDFIDTCGYPRQGAGAGYTLAMLMAEQPEQAKKVKTFLSVGDYVNFVLTGVKKREISTASSLTFRDKLKGEDWKDFIAASKIDLAILPPVCQSGEFIGHLTPNAAKLCGLPQDTPVFAGGHDYLCGAFAAGCAKEGDVINVLGTYEMTGAFFSKPKKDFYNPNFFCFMDNHTYPGSFAVTTEHLGVRYIQEYYPELNTGELTLEQRFIQLDKNPNSQETLKKALTEMNEKSVKAIEYLRGVTGNTPLCIKVIGGGSHSRYWLQSKANAIGATLTVPRITEASATGAALLAGCGAGVFTNYHEALHLYDGVATDYFQPEF